MSSIKLTFELLSLTASINLCLSDAIFRKTSILNKFLFKKFETKYKPTVEDLFSKEFDLGSIQVKVDFLDTSGSMQFPAMRRLSITTGSAFLIVYAVDDETSYDVLKMCIQEIQEIRPDYQVGN